MARTVVCLCLANKLPAHSLPHLLRRQDEREGEVQGGRGACSAAAAGSSIALRQLCEHCKVVEHPLHGRCDAVSRASATEVMAAHIHTPISTYTHTYTHRRTRMHAHAQICV